MHVSYQMRSLTENVSTPRFLALLNTTVCYKPQCFRSTILFFKVLFNNQTTPILLTHFFSCFKFTPTKFKKRQFSNTSLRVLKKIKKPKKRPRSKECTSRNVTTEKKIFSKRFITQLQKWTWKILRAKLLASRSLFCFSLIKVNTHF